MYKFTLDPKSDPDPDPPQRKIVDPYPPKVKWILTPDWFPACAAIFANMSQPFIISASLLCSHQMQIDYSDNPELIVAQPIEVEKKFPFLRRLVYHAG